MNKIEDILDTRYSCRKFKEQEIPRAVLENIFKLAQKTPSWCNSQAWHVTIVSGTALKNFKEKIYCIAEKGEPQNPDLKFPEKYEGIYKERRKVCGVQLYQSLGIGRNDLEQAQTQVLENFKCFDAPHLAMISSSRPLGIYGAGDCGLYISTLMLVAQSLGVNSIAQAALASYPNVVREELGISEDLSLIHI